MATLADNQYYCVLGGVNISAYVTDIKEKPKNDVKDTTAGAGQTHKQRSPGLDDYSFDVTLVHDAATLQAYIQKLKPGTVQDFEYGEEGNVAGKPRHVQSTIVASVSKEQKVDKEMVSYQVTLDGAAAPTFNKFAGATY